LTDNKILDLRALNITSKRIGY